MITFNSIIQQIEKEINEKKIEVYNNIIAIGSDRYFSNQSVAFVVEKCYQNALNIVKEILRNGERNMNFESYMIDENGNFSFISSDITDINIIVPNKVVEVIFADGKKEKMVCNEEDVFNLRNCLFIAIAKHLYKKEYTLEGIEWKAFELTYLKKYVKIVDSALKAYDKKQKDIARLEENYKAEQESIERKRVKKQAYKERRTARREQEEMNKQIIIQKEAYLQAMKCMEESKNVANK